MLRLKAGKNEEEWQTRMPLVEAFIVNNIEVVRRMAQDAFDGRRPDMMRLEDLSRRMIKQFG